MNSRNSNNPKSKEYYNSYSKRLNKVIREAKIMHYRKQILASQNKTKTIWNNVKSETKKGDKEDTAALDINGRLIQNQQTLADTVNNYFSNVAEKLRESYRIDNMTMTQKEATIDKVLRIR